MRLFAELDLRYRFVRRRWRYVFALVDAVGRRLTGLLRRRAPAPTAADDVRRILLIQLDHLGDAIITTSMLPALRRRFPQAVVDVLAAPWNAEVFAVRREAGRIHVSRRNRFARSAERFLWPLATAYWAWKLRARRYDLALDVRGDFSVALLMFGAGIPRRIGWNCAGGGFLLTDGVPYVRARPEIDSRREMLRVLGVSTSAASQAVPHWEPNAASESFVRHLAGEFGRGERPLFVFHLGAGTAAKTWPIEHWRELLGRSILDFDARVILVGGRGDVRTARELTQEMFWPNVMDWTDRLTLDQLAALCRRAALFVGADSGPAHLAAAVGAKVVVLFSGTNDANQWRPVGDDVTVVRREVACAPCYAVRCPLRTHPCMRDLTPTDVVAAIERTTRAPVAAIAPHWNAAARRERRNER